MDYGAEQDKNVKDIEKLAYIISHDLQGPLRRIHSFSEISRMLLENNSEASAGRVSNYLKKIETICQESEQMIFALLNLCKIGGEGATRTNIPIDKLIQNSLLPFEGAISRKEVEIDFDDSVIDQVFINSHQLRDVFFNLIGNAIKFKKPNTDLKLRIESSVVENGFLLVKLTDNGIGIKDTSVIFGMHEREHLEVEGHGIGLSSVKKIIEAHQGKIWCESEFGSGSSFFFTLPLASD